MSILCYIATLGNYILAMSKPVLTNDLESLVDLLLAQCDGQIKLAAPLGLGKPNHFLNTIYQRVKAAPSDYHLTIYTALSLKIPQAKQPLEKRFLQPFVKRHFGEDYPQLEYVIDRDNHCLPNNIKIHEFYFSSGSQLGNDSSQQDYISQNYTHVARDLVSADIDIVVQQVAQRGDQISLSSNPDVLLDLIDEMKQHNKPLTVVGVINNDLPFLGGEAQVEQNLFDYLHDDAQSIPLFGVPKERVSSADHAIGLHASTLVKDGGTLQIGIGALSDAIVNALIIRQQDNSTYQKAIESLNDTLANDYLSSLLLAEHGSLQPFDSGLYGATEMVMDGFMHLRKAGILKRQVFDDLKLQDLLDRKVITNPLGQDSLENLLEHSLLTHKLNNHSLDWLKQFGLTEETTRIVDQQLILTKGESIGIDLTDSCNFEKLQKRLAGRSLKGGRYLEGAFYLGSKDLYQWFKQLSGDDWSGLWMRRVSHINELLGGQETLDRIQRRQARFFNTCMIHTLTGAAVSDGLENAQVVSGVGGQYNFVAMAHSLSDGRSVLMLRSTRLSNGKVESNIRWNYGHITIPRHLRDIVITEYGIADLRGQSDQEVIKRMLSISDSRFQLQLLAAAKKAGKIATDFELPKAWGNNNPQTINQLNQLDAFNDYPFGSDFDSTELQLIRALTKLKSATSSLPKKLLTIASALAPQRIPKDKLHYLERMGLSKPSTLSERITAKLLCRYL
ncbi:MAG: acetyl-CoA hydrolase/transferase C-terminal domain-containing protein [Kangiellaceae bacterium]